MKNFTETLPGSNNVKGSGVGSPAGDVNKLSKALVEVRSNVPNTPGDINAATAAQMTDLANRVSSLVTRVNNLKRGPISDAFTRTEIGASYTIVSGGIPTLANNQISQGNTSSFFIANLPTKTYQQYAEMLVVATSTTTGHPQIVWNYTTESYYRAVYSTTNLRWELYRMLNGTETMIASAPDSRPSASYTLRGSQYQNTVSVTVNNSVKININETSPLHGKQIGVNIPGITGTNPARVLDNLTYSDI